MIGKTLAHYEITGLLGKGGMGEVYRARDTRLGREVAIKVLPREMSEDPERIARFQREARTLASLQHPHVASIYGFEDTPEARFLVMELVEGEDLSQRLKTETIPLVRAMSIGRDILDGLEAAHERGIVHRDLKPANIKINSAGQVKILDFGLARAYSVEPESDEDLENSPTITAAMTQAGTILGTAAYMSPEQAKGRRIDKRTDLWSFGVILYEMLSGDRLFEGETVSDTLAAVLRAEPDFEKLPANTPRRLRRLLARCLERNPRQRLRDAGDARIELEDLLAGGAEVAENAGGDRGTRLAAIGFAVASLLLAIGWGLQIGFNRTPDEQALIAFDINPPLGHAMREFAVAPDGSALVVVASDRVGFQSLWLRRFDREELHRLPGTEQASFPFWSPDSRSVAFFADGTLRRIDLANENVRTIADAPNGRGGAWSPDGKILFAPEGEAVLHTVSGEGGTPQPLTTFVAEEVTTHRFPHFAPDGKHFTFCAHSDNSTIVHRYFQSMDDPRRVRLPDGLSESYPLDDQLLYVRETDLVAQRFDSRTGELSGDATFLAADIQSVVPRTGRAGFSVSNNGVLAYLPERPTASHFAWLDRSGRVVRTSPTVDEFVFPECSPDLRFVSFVRFGSDATSLGDVWVHDLARGSSRRLGRVTANGSLGWGADGRSILYPHEHKLWRQDIDSGQRDLIVDFSKSEASASLSAARHPREASDGSFIVFGAWDSATDFDLWIVRKGETEPQRLIGSPELQSQSEISPDNRWIAYSSAEAGRSDVYVCGIQAPATGRIVSTDGGGKPVWDDDGTKLYYISAETDLMEVEVLNEGARIEFGLPKALFRAPPGTIRSDLDDYFQTPSLLRARNGEFLFHTPAEEVPPRVIKVWVNWERRLDG